MKTTLNALLIALVSTLLMLSGCSKEEDKESKPASAEQAPAGKTLPPSHPATMPQQGQQQSQQQAPKPKTLGPGQGKVVKVMHASGYTYMEVDLGNNKNTWLASTSIKVKTGDTVQWQDAIAQRNFSSKTLRRTFDEILFVSNTSVLK